MDWRRKAGKGSQGAREFGVKAFVDDAAETKTIVPRSPEMGERGREIGGVRISY